jgi:hypothetical protein
MYSLYITGSAANVRDREIDRSLVQRDALGANNLVQGGSSNGLLQCPINRLVCIRQGCHLLHAQRFILRLHSQLKGGIAEGNDERFPVLHATSNHRAKVNVCYSLS